MEGDRVVSLVCLKHLDDDGLVVPGGTDERIMVMMKKLVEKMMKKK